MLGIAALGLILLLAPVFAIVDLRIGRPILLGLTACGFAIWMAATQGGDQFLLRIAILIDAATVALAYAVMRAVLYLKGTEREKS